MKKINIPNLRKKYWDTGEILTEVLSNTQYVKDLNRKFYDTVYKLPKKDAHKALEKHDLIIKSRVNEFKELFGKQDFSYNREYRYYAWAVEHNGCEAIIFTAKGKGTTVELILNEMKRPKGSVREFYNEFKRIMESYE